jgi:hypothetical protein
MTTSKTNESISSSSERTREKTDMQRLPSLSQVSIETSGSDCSEDSHVARYSGRRRPPYNPLKQGLRRFVACEPFIQCLGSSHGTADTENNTLANLVKFTTVLPSFWGDLVTLPRWESAPQGGQPEECIEIGEQDILLRDYDLARV